MTFDGVRVPVENTLGSEGAGIFVMLRSVSSMELSLQRPFIAYIVTLIMSVGSCAAHLLVRNASLSKNVCCTWGSYLPIFIPRDSDGFPRWTTQRKAFGKPLHSQAVIRSKLAAMISRVESTQNWLENLTYQMNNMVRSVTLLV